MRASGLEKNRAKQERAVSGRLFFYARFCCKAVEQETAAGFRVAGVLLEKIPGAAEFFSEGGAHSKAGEQGAAAVKRLDHADVSEQVVSVLDHIVIEFGAGRVCHSVASYYGFKPL